MDDLDLIPFATPLYWVLLAVGLFGRAMDFLSTWVATPHLVLEGNPLAKWMGWRVGMIVNVMLCFVFAFSLFTAVIVATMSLLVAARNFQSAWMMRAMGEHAYQSFMSDLLHQSGALSYLLTAYAQSLLMALIGFALLLSGYDREIPFAIGMGTVAYAGAVAVYTTLAIWRRRRG